MIPAKYEILVKTLRDRAEALVQARARETTLYDQHPAHKQRAMLAHSAASAEAVVAVIRGGRSAIGTPTPSAGVREHSQGRLPVRQ